MASGCQACASTGQCNAAFHNGPGRYCGAFYDIAAGANKPCCCPLQSTCKVSPTQCMCHVSGGGPQGGASSNYYPPLPHHGANFGHQYQPASPLAPLFFILLCVCCCALCCRRRDDDHQHRHHSGHIPVATAVPETCPPSENPAYHAQNYGSTFDGKPQSGGGGGAAIASGLGGLAVGTIIGDLIGRNTARANTINGWFGAAAGGGGYDIVGDGGGGYDIAGDSGGGYDFAGDSGGDGGYDIAGDS